MEKEGATLNLELLERRKECLKMYSRGLGVTVWAKDVAEAYKTTENAIRRDWARREEWILQIINLDNSESLVHELYNNLEQTKNAAWGIYHTAENQPSAQVGALKHIMDAVRIEVEILQSLGKMPRVPDRIEQRETGEKKIIVKLWENEPRNNP